MSAVQQEIHDAEAPAAEQAPARIRTVSGTAGHGVARAYGYAVLAAALGVRAELIEGSTRSGQSGLRIAVYAPGSGDDAVLDRIDALYDELAPQAESAAAVKRAQARKEAGHSLAGYEINRFTRAVIAGFAEGAARVLRTEDALRPAPYKSGSRARAIDEKAHAAGMRSGRAYAEHMQATSAREG